MKKAKIMAVAFAIATASTAFAQFTTGGAGKSSTSNAGNIADYNILGVSYTNERLSYDFEDGPDPVSLNGFSIKYLHGFSLSGSLPMYIETGLNFNYNFGSLDADEDGYTVQKYQMSALAVPVNFAWKFNINDNFAIKPYLGLNLKINLIGKTRMELTDKFKDDWKEVYGEAYDGETESDWASFYSKDDMGDKDSTWNRFQLGWHIGADLMFNKFIVGLNYGTDIIPAFKYKKSKVNSATFNVGIGFCF